MLKSIRRKNGLNQSQLAEKLDISKGYMNKLENYPQLCNPTINLILKISQELNVNPLKIFLFFIENR